MAGFDDLSARASAAQGMKGGGGAGMDPMADAPPEEGPPMDPTQDASDTGISAALDAIDQAADVYGDDVANEIRQHVNAIRELVSQGEASEPDTPEDEMATQSPDADSSADTSGNMSSLPEAGSANSAGSMGP